MATLSTPLVDVVGGRTATALDKAFEMRTVRDLLAHYPRRMAERGELTELSSLQVDEEVTVVADVLSATVHNRPGGQPRLEVVVGDGRARLHLVFFGKKGVYANKNQLQPGSRGLFSGKVGLFNTKRQLVHPDYLLLRGDIPDELEADVYAGRLIPVYPATQAVRTWTISRAVQQALAMLDLVPDPLTAELRGRHKLLSSDTALRAMHQPDDYGHWQAARKRLAWDEALGVQLALAQRRFASSANPATPRPARSGGLLDAFDAQLPFTLTTGQREIGDLLGRELAAPHPMHRLLQGEVGSGKTIVALRAMLQAVDSGAQAALLAPTEVLAAQHARTIESLLGPLAQRGRLGGSDAATRVTLLTGSLPTAARRAALLEAASGEAGIVVGTHALIQEHVQFAELGLVVVDEQHRFGVEQRDALRSKAEQPPHVLVMTATPIPRTVAMTVFGDLETSTLSELPAGRAPITTSVVPAREKPAWLERAWSRIREEVAAGRQAYIVCPRIGVDVSDCEADMIDVVDDGETERRPPLAVVDILPMLADGPLHGLRLAPLHGRLTPEEKDRTMTEFAAGRIDVLVATTVIEVGVDVPNATVMAVLDADRFGVSQLHQLRGRIGRGGHAGLCLLVTDARADAPARERLDAVAATTDGFELARLDVEQRREGDVLGAAQSGRRRRLRLLSLLRDEDLIASARAEAVDIVAADPTLASHPLLAAQVAALVDDEQAEFLEKT
ncbi:MAG TPA: ATP-dependent DNA helicase RecG [Jatrophihabitans sp.]|uniref:ATP-dependent DNA helicase RecG n=1 Tax=Jatrophihabitans sp. TaxID=1932789 RepID=UPI002E0C5095|nr:ATP-dependent DNA helicase RecG [Jatrophihabitans sp.]